VGLKAVKVGRGGSRLLLEGRVFARREKQVQGGRVLVLALNIVARSSDDERSETFVFGFKAEGNLWPLNANYSRDFGNIVVATINQVYTRTNLVVAR